MRVKRVDHRSVGRSGGAARTSVRASRRDRPAKTPSDPARRTRLPLPNRPSIAVLPLTAIGADEDSGYFAEGVADDIITELSRNRDLFVVARHSSFRIAEQESDPAAIGQALGVRHLLTGSVRRARDRLRLSLHLIECESGSEAWAERYDRRLEDLFDVQLEVARIVTSTIAGRLTALAGEAIATKAPENFEADDHVLRAQRYLQRYTRADYACAREHLEAAIRADPFYARPYGLLCIAGVYDWFWEMSEDGLAGVLDLPARIIPELALMVGYPAPVTAAPRRRERLNLDDVIDWERVGGRLAPER